MKNWKERALFAISIVGIFFAVVAGTLNAGSFFWKLGPRITALENEFSLNDPEKEGRVTKLEGELRSLNNSKDGRITKMEGELRSLNNSKDGRVTKLEGQLSGLSNPKNGRIAKLESQLSRLNDPDGRIAAVEDGLSDVANKLRQTVSRVPALETGLSEIDVPETFDAVYVFKYTLDFPNPSFEVNKDDARSLVCAPDVDELLEEEQRAYREKFAAFNGLVKLRFSTMGNATTTILQETACYGKMPIGKDTGPVVAHDVRITPAPVNFLLRAASRIVGRLDEPPRTLELGHNDRDTKIFSFDGLPHAGRQDHSVTAVVLDREHDVPNRGDYPHCSDYGVKVATGELDRCDFEVFVFAHLNLR